MHKIIELYMLLVQVLASDDDQGENGVIILSIDDEANFAIASNGWITTIVTFNFEENNQYTFMVTATGKF